MPATPHPDALKVDACPKTGQPLITLASGHKMPMIAFGTWKSAPGVTKTAVHCALKAGFTNLDCANDYNNEDEVGAALKEAFENGTVKREDLFIQAKLWNSNHRPEHIMEDLQATLDDLQIDYLDSYVIHWPQAVPSTGKQATLRKTGAFPAHYTKGIDGKEPMFPIDDKGYFCTDKESHYIETWHFMEGLVDQGLVKSIGISNFNRRQILEVVAATKKHPVSTLQNECHPYLQQKELIDVCRINKIAFQAFSPLGSGDTHLAVHSSPTGVIPLKDPFIGQLAEKYKKSPAQIMLRWNHQRGVSLVTKSVTPARIEQNFQIRDFELSEEDMKEFDKINFGWRHLLWYEASDHPDYPFKDEIPHDYVLEKAPEIGRAHV